MERQWLPPAYDVRRNEPGKGLTPFPGCSTLLELMRDIRDLMSDQGRHLRVEQVVFTEVVIRPTETHRRCYLGASSTGRFLLMGLRDPRAADHPIEPPECTFIYARNANADYMTCGDMILVTSRPRSQCQPDMERTFHHMEATVHRALNMGLALVEPGSIRWSGDQFSAEYAQLARVKPGSASGWIRGSDGKDMPESVKAKVLAQIRADPSNPKGHFVVEVVSSPASAVERVTVTRLERPAPGSIEAQPLTQAQAEAREAERIRRGIQGRLVRDEQGRATEVILQCQPPCQVRFHYEGSGDVPPPFPHRVDRFVASTTSQSIIHSLRLAEQPLEDAAFDPWPRLKPGEFARGVWSSDGSSVAADAESARILHEFVKKSYFEPKRKAEGQSGSVRED